MKPFDERLYDAAEGCAEGIGELKKLLDEGHGVPWVIVTQSFKEGAQWSRTETIRDVFELLRSDDCDKFIGLTLSYYGGEDGPSIAKWLADKLGVKGEK